MEKFIPYEKLSKKEKRKIDQARRQTWGELNPVTRKPENSKAYNRRKSQDWKRELPPNLATFLILYHKLQSGLFLHPGYPKSVSCQTKYPHAPNTVPEQIKICQYQCGYSR